jgi:hypothetical protein
MKFFDRVIRRKIFVPLPALLLSGLLVVGCVDLAKPDTVKTHCSTGSELTCVDNYEPDAFVPPDLGPDGQGDAGQDQKSDLPPADEPTARNDTAPDIAPDASAVDTLDALVIKKDGAGPDVRQLLDVEESETMSSRPEVTPDSSIDSSSESDLAIDVGYDLGPDPDLRLDLPGDRSSETDTPTMSNCTIYYGSTIHGQLPKAGTADAFCVATCDDIAGWGCSNFGGRSVTVNGTAVTSCEGTTQAALVKKNGYNVFQVSAGTSVDATIFWWGTYSTSCSAPDGGVFP